MTKVAKKVMGDGGAEKAMRAQQSAINSQRAAIDAESRRVGAIEEGQRRSRGGGGGFLAYIEDQLQKTFG